MVCQGSVPVAVSDEGFMGRGGSGERGAVECGPLCRERFFGYNAERDGECGRKGVAVIARSRAANEWALNAPYVMSTSRNPRGEGERGIYARTYHH